MDKNPHPVIGAWLIPRSKWIGNSTLALKKSDLPPTAALVHIRPGWKDMEPAAPALSADLPAALWRLFLVLRISAKQPQIVPTQQEGHLPMLLSDGKETSLHRFHQGASK